MALEIPRPVRILNPEPVDYYYLDDGSAWADIATVRSTIALSARYQGMTVNILGVEYWWKDGTADIDLVMKDSSVPRSYTHVQGTGAITWSIPHNLGKRVNVTAYDNSGNEWKGELDYVDDNNVTVTFSFALAGYAMCT